MTGRPAKGGRRSRGRGGPWLPTILLVDPDEERRAMLRDALLEGARPFELRTVAGARDLDAYLAREGGLGAPVPTLVLVDLEPRDAEPLRSIERLKGDPAHRRTPVIALSRGVDADELAAAYDAGANTVLPRPVTFLALVRLMKVFTAYWLEAAALPGEAA